MSVEANTYEEMTIHNVNSMTAEVARQLGEYLLKTWGIQKLMLTVDGVHYGDDVDDTIHEGTELYAVCARLAEAQEIAFTMRSENGGGASWRLESCFMKALTNDEKLKNNIVYRSMDYYDTDPDIEMYLYDENGLQEPKYTGDVEIVKDIKRWYCYTPILRIADEEQLENTELHDAIISSLTELCEKCFGLNADEIEDKLEDDWEDFGEIILNGSLSFEGECLSGMIRQINELCKIAQGSETMEIELEIDAVPDGEGDYNFASVALAYDGETVRIGCCRF